MGCSREASFAASIASSSSPWLVEMIRVSTRPRATTPPSSRMVTSVFWTRLMVLAGRSTITGVSRFGRRGP
jgi:hypothetical protein